MSFVQGFIGGFEVSNRIRDRARSRELQERSLSLADAANARAEDAAVRNQQTFDTARERQGDLDRSNELLAKRSRGEEFTQDETDEFNRFAAINPSIRAELERDEEQRGLEEFIPQERDRRRAGLAAVTGTPGVDAPSGVVTPGAGAPAAAPGEPQTPLQSVLEPGTRGATEENIQGVAPPEQTGTRFVAEGDLMSITGVDNPEAFKGLTREPNTNMFEIPASFHSKDDIAALPIDEQVQARNENREQLGDLGHLAAAARAAEGMDEATADSVEAFMNPDDPNGEPMRQLVNSNPQMVINDMVRNYEAINRASENTSALMITQMLPVAEKQIEVVQASMRNIPVNADGMVDPQTDEQRAVVDQAKRNLDSVAFIRDRANELGIEGVSAGIRGNAMPVGNPELTAAIMEEVANTTLPGSPATTSEFNANRTVAGRAAKAVQSGDERMLTTKQVEGIAWMVTRGYITPEGFEEILSGQEFSNAADVEIFDHDPEKALMRKDAAGNVSMILAPSVASDAALEARNMVAGEQQEIIRDIFQGHITATSSDADREAARMDVLGFYEVLKNNAVEMFGATNGEYDVRRLSNLNGSQMHTLALRYIQLKEVRTVHDGRIANMWPFGDQFDEKFGTDFFTDPGTDDIARELGIELSPLPTEMQVNVREARVAMLQGGTRNQQVIAQSGTALEVAQEVMGDVRSRRPQ